MSTKKQPRAVPPPAPGLPEPPADVGLNTQTMLVLYVEDEEDLAQKLTTKLSLSWESRGTTWMLKVHHARSLKGASALLESENFDVVIHDAGIFYSETGGSPRSEYGDKLYVRLVAKQRPVLVISSDESAKTREPYRSYPPALGFLAKGSEIAEIRSAIEEFFLGRLVK